jgi:hypothetical protein
METASVEGVVCALVSFDYDMRQQGGPQGTSWAVWVTPDFGSEPIKVKLPTPELVSTVEEAGFGASVAIDYVLSANVKGTRAVIDRRASTVTVVAAVKGRRAPLTAAG